jgi:hypothetical protein
MVDAFGIKTMNKEVIKSDYYNIHPAASAGLYAVGAGTPARREHVGAKTERLLNPRLS